MIKVIMLLKRKPGLSLAEFVEHYENVHVPLVEKLATRARRYERHFLHPMGNVVAGGDPLEPEYDVVTEIWYDDLAAFTDEKRDARQHPELVAAVIADEKVLFDRAKTRFAFAEDRVSTLGVGSQRATDAL
ncbi:EthD domain-containing protein [Frankia sp. CNm7]|uniref:EthD domain-containing protein n=1 Tax=Frankia nepalensis TaxID=1836974 RepID=A0A937RP57_9ACTN|nr:EthD domain-containing protein [Frankia nepalensis]MBL7501500.1 EthD domain-containing protein [Frankia nepalensis]MBL7513628.1 EthD domain-containing protein [Frankia nepalensis]MBL7523849.1 EthD domain-containing protein [Frankia nepalensis]MBL7633755.1 EthD domain-containing protein [Frankia nepalensis]